jgi:hypothetical protein
MRPTANKQSNSATEITEHTENFGKNGLPWSLADRIGAEELDNPEVFA